MEAYVVELNFDGDGSDIIDVCFDKDVAIDIAKTYIQEKFYIDVCFDKDNERYTWEIYEPNIHRNKNIICTWIEKFKKRHGVYSVNIYKYEEKK